MNKNFSTFKLSVLAVSAIFAYIVFAPLFAQLWAGLDVLVKALGG
jgi:hypothetical protein